MNEAEKQSLLLEVANATAKIVELKNLVRDSLPLRAVGGGHLHNELLVLNDTLTRIDASVTALVVT